MTEFRKFTNRDVRTVFDSMPMLLRSRLLEVREAIFSVAERSKVIGDLEESLKWGEPSYAPKRPRIGSPVRINSFGPRDIALFFNCNTLLVEEFRARYGNALRYTRNRAVILDAHEELPVTEIRECVETALTYHWRKKNCPVSARVGK